MPQQVNDVDELRKWLNQCPAIKGKKKFLGVNFLAEKPTEFAIFSQPSTLSYRENVLGERMLNDIQTQNYVFASKENYSNEIKKNVDILGWYQEVMAWIITQSNAQNFPPMAEGPIVSILPTLTAYPASVGSNTATYQIQIAVRYRYTGEAEQ